MKSVVVCTFVACHRLRPLNRHHQWHGNGKSTVVDDFPVETLLPDFQLPWLPISNCHVWLPDVWIKLHHLRPSFLDHFDELKQRGVSLSRSRTIGDMFWLLSWAWKTMHYDRRWVISKFWVHFCLQIWQIPGALPGTMK
jgi:hypothetical protein